VIIHAQKKGGNGEINAGSSGWALKNHEKINKIW